MALSTGRKEMKEIEESWYFPLLFVCLILKSYAGGLIVQTRTHVSACHLSHPLVAPGAARWPRGRWWKQARFSIKQAVHLSLQRLIERVPFQTSKNQ